MWKTPRLTTLTRLPFKHVFPYMHMLRDMEMQLQVPHIPHRPATWRCASSVTSCSSTGSQWGMEVSTFSWSQVIIRCYLSQRTCATSSWITYDPKGDILVVPIWYVVYEQISNIINSVYIKICSKQIDLAQRKRTCWTFWIQCASGTRPPYWPP